MNIRPTKPDERLYFYAQSGQLKLQCGSIGHLRGNFDSSGNMFHTTWNDHCELYKTTVFQAELDKVINALRFDEQYGKLLASRNAMTKYCYKQKDSAFKGSYCTEYGFRADTDNHTYVIRCNPSNGDYNFYVFCYVSKWLDAHLKNAEKGIRFIDPNYNGLFHIRDGEKIIITCSDGEKISKTCRFIDECHTEVGANLYHICEFAERMKSAGNQYEPEQSLLPEMCYSTLPSSGEIIIIKHGEKGYTITGLPKNHSDGSRSYADIVNKTLGVSKAQESAMFFGSMFGWDVPGADPRNYDERGIAIKTSALNTQKTATDSIAKKSKSKDFER